MTNCKKFPPLQNLLALLFFCAALLGFYQTAGDNVFDDPIFWPIFVDKVKSGAWSCSFQEDVLHSSLERDAALYEDDTLFRRRREGVRQWTANTTLWTETILGAIRELSRGEGGRYTHQLRDLHMLEAFSDYIHHLNFFQMVAKKMASLGEQVKPFNLIHDIDKLDPVMMVGYSERFEDRTNTSVWNVCVERHTKVNPHHQAHCMWAGGCHRYEKTKRRALGEMVCDKVSRRVQKDLAGELTKEMWNVDMSFFVGLPEHWLNQARSMMACLKRNDSAY